MITPAMMTLVAATALTVGAALGGCGTNTTAPSSSPTSSQQVAQDHNQADITFAQGMIPHHAQAIVMARTAAQRAGSPQVKDLAARIQAAQQPEIDQMREFLRAWNASVPSIDSSTGGMGRMDHGAGGAMPGMMSGEQMHQLGQVSGAAFDRMFLQMMIAHHQGAVAMAKAELNDGQKPAARQLAQRVSTPNSARSPKCRPSSADNDLPMVTAVVHIPKLATGYHCQSPPETIAVFPDGPHRYFDTVFSDDYCHRHELLTAQLPVEPDEIAQSGRVDRRTGAGRAELRPAGHVPSEARWPTGWATNR